MGLQEHDVPNLEKYLFDGKYKIIFPNTFSRKYNLTNEQTKNILAFLVEKNILSFLYRVKIDPYYWDFNKLNDIPAEIEIDDKVIDNVLERTYILFQVNEYEK